MGRFSSIYRIDQPPNLFLMPSFLAPVLEQDGVHPTQGSGLEYLFFLFDLAPDIIELSKKEPEVKISTDYEATRVLEDRVMAVEQDHHRLNKAFEMSTAITSERKDFQENIRNEVYFMVTGLPSIQGLRGHDLMTRAISDVVSMIKTLLGKELKVLVVHSATGRRETKVRYSVQMEYTLDSQ